MMKMITPRFQMLLQQTATKIMKHGMHQDNPGGPQPTCRTALSRQMLFLVWSCMWLSTGEQWPSLPYNKKIQQPMITFDYSQLSSHASFCCSHMQEGGRHLTSESSMTGTGRSPPSFAEMLHYWLLAHKMGRMVWTDCRAAHVTCAFVLQAEWEVFLWNLHVFTQVLMPVILALIFVFWSRDSTSWYTDALSELKSWQILLIIFARAPQGRQATLSRCVSRVLAY